MTEKKANYTDEMVATISEVYMAQCGIDGTDETRKAAMESLAESCDKTVASIRAKLSHLGIYIPLAKAEKSATKRTTKAELVQSIADFAQNDNEQFFESLTGANQNVLKYVIGLQNQVSDFLNDEIESDESESS